MKKLLFVSFSLLGLASAGFAQQKKVVADKILGIVGDKIILYSDVQNSIADIARQGGTVPENAQCSVLEQALVSKVLMLQAEKDSLVVTPEEVEAELDQRVRYFIRQYGSQEAVEQLAGKTVYQIKDEARESVRERKLAEAMQRKIVDPVRITPAEVKVYFDRVPADSLPFFETEVEVGQIVVYPKATRDLEKYASDELMNIKKQIDGKLITFGQAAKRYSDDPGTKDREGEFQINRNDKSVDPTFLAASFRLKDGEISPIIRSKFGFHLIQMVHRSGDDAVVKHILKIPPVTDEEMTAGVAKLDSVRAKLIAGTIDFNGAAGKYSEDEQSKFAGPYIISGDGDTYNRIDELDKDVVALLDKLKVGEFSQPTVFMDERVGKKAVRILYLKSRSQPHRMNLRDDYNKISSAALEEKKYLALDKWLSTHIPNYYVMIDQDEAGCPQLQKWITAKTVASK
ncbi:MAG TPA: peptidylprolyl isomerase [Flavisolibacter sp.]|nr:peptidylprolyl isomerase [Flavisolibacter sp.]